MATRRASTTIAGLSRLLLALILASVSARAHALVATPFHDSDVLFATTGDVLVYSVDLGSLPGRPALIVEASPDPAHPDLRLEIQISACTLFDASGYCPPVLPEQPDLGVGSKRLVSEPFRCDVRSDYVGETCSVSVRVVDFGSTGAPASVDVSIRGETRPPTGTEEFVVDPALWSTSVPATRDTTLYQANTSSGNGAGESFWSTFSTTTTARHGLVDFPVATYVPAHVEILDAWLQLSVLTTTAGAAFSVHAVPDAIDWIEGTQNAAGDESTPPAAGVGPQATWLYRRWNSLFQNVAPWTTPGGDREPGALLTSTVTATGPQSFGSTAWVDHVRQIHAGTVARDGLLVVPVSGSIRFASRENATFFARPSLIVQHTAPPMQEEIDTGTMNFFNEAQNFRWIYDLDGDNVLITPIAGRCEALNPATGGPIHGITYQYLGDPADARLDCCTWQVGSTTGVTGTGQAIFYVNMDPNDPANQPGDLDTDGIRDLCDNCPTRPNGPLLGSCISGTKIGKLCRSNQQCPGGTCSLSQDDANRVLPGDACVPEPGLAAMLGAGLAMMALRGRREA
ncbi:MAG: hypothetical protein IPK00_17655 [Deltaproteobacteria bacterium]|nr:hypothetical protein [Deltaproteobacteria bacterium]